MTVHSLKSRLTGEHTTANDVLTAAVILALGLGLLIFGVRAFSEFPVVIPFEAHQLHWWHAAPLVLISAATCVQTRYPRGVFSIITVLFVADMAMGLYLAVLIGWANTVYNASRYTAGGPLRWFVLAFNAVVFLWIFAFTGDTGAALNGLAQVGLTSLIAIWWGSEVRSGDVRAEAERLASLAARRREEQEREELLRRQRADLAAQLHDTISSHLSTIALYTAASLETPRHQEQDQHVLQEVRHASLAALTDMRELINVLRPYTTPADTTESGTESVDVSELLRRFRAAGLEITETGARSQQLANTVDLLDPESSGLLIQVLQEAFANALKHGDGTVQLHCTQESDYTAYTVRNPVDNADDPETDTPSRPVALSGGLGLGTLAALIHQANGTFTAGTHTEAGHRIWRLHFELPHVTPSPHTAHTNRSTTP